MTDPFEHMRANRSNLRATDRLDEDELRELKYEILNTYMTWATKSEPTQMKVDDALAKMQPIWVKTCESALAQSRHVQRLVLNEELTPGCHNFKLLQINPDWLLGLYLPGFYDIFDSFDEGYQYIEVHIFKKAMGLAENVLKEIIRKHASRALDNISFDSRTGQAPLPPVPTNEFIATLFRIAQEEKTQNNLRVKVYRDLRDLKAFLPFLDGGAELFSQYQETIWVAKDTLIDQFTKPMLELINDLGDIPALTPVDMSTTSIHLETTRALADFAGPDANECDEVAEDDLPGNDDELAVPGQDMDTTDFDPAAEQHSVKEEALSWYEAHQVFYYPNWRSPTTGPVLFRSPKPGEVLEASQEPESSQPSVVNVELKQHTVLNKFRSMKGFIAARMLSEQEEEYAERNVTTEEDVLQGALAYTKSITNADDRRFHKKGYRECLAWMSILTQRSQQAVDADPMDVWFQLYSGFQMEDDWVHVRFLLEALRIDLQRSSEDVEALIDSLNSSETYLMCIFAIIRSGADDPLPWFLVLDGLLRIVWDNMCATSIDPTVYQTKVFDELVAWVDGTALNAFVIRVPRRLRNKENVLKDWYPLLYNYDPHCANEDCTRLLTHPDNMDGKTFRSSLSVGTRETRVGMRGIRAFLSKNRNQAYPCLYDVTRCYQPINELIIIFFWYSHLFHNNTCKVTRGKYAVNAF